MAAAPGEEIDALAKFVVQRSGMVEGAQKSP
jgi:hypothetical protein